MHNSKHPERYSRMPARPWSEREHSGGELLHVHGQERNASHRRPYHGARHGEDGSSGAWPAIVTVPVNEVCFTSIPGSIPVVNLYDRVCPCEVWDSRGRQNND